MIKKAQEKNKTNYLDGYGLRRATFRSHHPALSRIDI